MQDGRRQQHNDARAREGKTTKRIRDKETEKRSKISQTTTRKEKARELASLVLSICSLNGVAVGQ
jgi:hypothetical protein